MADRADEMAREELVVDLGPIETRGKGGAIWSLPHGGDLDANLVRLHPNESIGFHVNDEVDVLISVIAGGGHIRIGTATYVLRPEVVAHIPRSAGREIRAGADGITYLSVHRRRGPLVIRT